MSPLVYIAVSSRYPLKTVELFVTLDSRESFKFQLVRFDVIETNDDWSRSYEVSFIGPLEILNRITLARYTIRCVSRDRETPTTGVTFWTASSSMKLRCYPFDSEWREFLGIVDKNPQQQVTVTHAPQEFKGTGSGIFSDTKKYRFLIMRQLCSVEMENRDVPKSWVGESYGLPSWALVMTDAIFPPVDERKVDIFGTYSDIVTPTTTKNEIKDFLKLARHACFASRATGRTRRGSGNLSFRAESNGIFSESEMASVTFAYHIADYLVGRLTDTSIYQPCILSLSKHRFLFALMANEQNNPVPIIPQPVDEDWLWSDEKVPKVTVATDVTFSRCLKRVAFHDWKTETPLAAIYQNDNGEPGISIFRSRRTFAELYNFGLKTTNAIFEAGNLKITPALVYELSVCRAINSEILARHMRRSNRYDSIAIPAKQRTDARTCGAFAYGITGVNGPCLKMLPRIVDQPLVVRYFDVWGRGDFFAIFAN